MTTTIYIPCDSTAQALGAEAVAASFASTIAQRQLDVTLVRNGSRGLFWLEPMIEVATPAGRVAYGPVAAEDVASLLDANVLAGEAHPLCLGKVDEIPYLQRQQRISLKRVGVTDPLSVVRLSGAWRHARVAPGINAHAA